MFNRRYIKIIFKYKVLRPLKRTFKKIIAQDSDVHSICMGLALGVFIGTLPMPGHMLLALFIAGIFHYNTVAAVAAVWLSNPFTYLPLYYSAYRIGLIFFKDSGAAFDFSHLNFHSIWDSGVKVFYPLLLGSVLLGLVLAIITYFVSRPILKRFLPLLKDKRHHLDIFEKK